MDHNFLNSTTHNVAWLHKRYLNEELVLKAPFQRNPVWTDKQKSYLIDTILRGYPIPELYMQEYTDDDGNDVYTVVDGQQRVRACIDFINGEFSLSEKDSPEWADLFFDDLTGADKKKIYNYNFVVRVLPEVPEAELRSIFSRINRYVVALNKQELRHATYWGEFITSLEAIGDNELWADINVFTPTDVRRMNDIEFISELAVGFLHGLQNKKSSLDRWYQAYEQEFPDRRRMERAFHATLSEIMAALPNIARTRWRKKSDFYSLFLLLAEIHRKFPLAADERKELGSRLEKFAELVDDHLRDPDRPGIPKHIRDYSVAVEKAASDLARRRARRQSILRALAPDISGLWPD
ncbi:hypothetical protein CO670_26820 [Rhizobium sp. J15]|uniref:DUF262 domain-containing protein n=1 Tax=Rhizobium sp. J15 TaxID=2035450 RepID=UPI000BE9C80B|nr:DUF262 domain-containing protein [Rhizobium sp. J15]PDT13749.1 hypothetical protein CO670_26820 [Rhizobium sp. J15]